MVRTTMRLPWLALVAVTGDAPARSVPTAACTAPRIVVQDDTVTVRCWPERNCSFEIEIDNCTDRPAALKRLVVAPERTDDGIEWRFERQPRVLAPHEVATFRYPPEGRHLELGGYRVLASVDDALAFTQFTVVDEALEEAKARCIARGDDWDSSEGCIEVMPDAGRPCVDERDCAGYCIQQKVVPISPLEQRVYGLCSRHDSLSGCHTLIGKTNGGLMPAGHRFVRTCAC